MTRWTNPTPVQIPDSLSGLSLPPLILETLVRRGYTGLDSAQAFLHPEAAPSALFPGIEKAAEIIRTAVQAGRRICVWGDFDVDGQTSTTLLVQTLQALEANVTYYIPVRSKESHGVHVSSLKPIIEGGAKLMLTCDTGVTAHEAIEFARSRGVDVIVTDHHDPAETLPNANAIINPKLLPEDHALANLAGVGVAYKLAEALLSGDRSSEIPNLLDLVALGLIADLALLRGETRSLAQRGIQALRGTGRLGLKRMAELSETNLDALTEETIGFAFAPRLNALGRLGDANPAIELLLTHDPVRANLLATQIEGLNTQRRLLTSQVYEAAEAQLRVNPDLLAEPVIILSHQNWPGGVVGIVAARLVERYHKPAVLLTSSEDGILRGSARSVDELHITEAIGSQRGLLLGFGGHPMAAGLSMEAGNLNLFRKGLCRAVEAQLGIGLPEEPSLQIDAWLTLNQLNLEFAEALETLAPFGAGNPALTLATHRVKMRSVSTMGRNREHFRLEVEDEAGRNQKIMWWGGAGEDLPEEGSWFDIAFSLRASTFRGERQITVQFEDFQIVEEKQPAEIAGRELEVIDLRSSKVPEEELAALIRQLPELEVWSEGSQRQKGKMRFELQAARELAVYTIPASSRDLAEALRIVRPEKVFLFALSGGEEYADQFLEHLAGLCKFAINERGGRATIQQLAGACSQRTASVRLGLEWLRASGHISFLGESDLVITAGDGRIDRILQQELYLGVKGILEETASYRDYYATTTRPDSLIAV